MCTYTDSTSLPNSYFFDIKEIKSWSVITFWDFIFIKMKSISKINL
jgi:hypothetical protein